MSLLIQSKKYPGQSFVGYALLHEFNPQRLSFFTAQKFPVDEELEIDVDFFGSKGHLKVRMANLHEQISSGRVMNAIPNEANPFPVRKFYRCYAVINALQGVLPGMPGATDGSLSVVPPAAPEAAPVAAEVVAEAPREGEPAVANAGDSLVTAAEKPADSDDVRAKLAAISGGAAETVSEEKQAA